MREQFAQKKLAWSKLTSQELTDLLVYLQNQPETKHLAANFSFPPSDSGEALFQAKGCNGCHTGKLALEGLLRNQTITDIAVDMWNHQPEMKQPPPAFTPEEMRQIIGYIWAKQYFRGNGSAGRGKKAVCLTRTVPSVITTRPAARPNSPRAKMHIPISP